ncbi:MAG: TGS domain-containing protein, partial [Thermoanaerobaculia bacterium]
MEALAQTVRIKLPDGSTKVVPKGTTLRQIAEAIGPRLAKDALAARLDGKLVDLARAVEADSSVEIVTGKSPEAVEVYRHSTAHLTANAVKRLFPDVQIGIGPAIEDGYYYDFNPKRPFTPEDLAAIEAEMRRIVAENNPIER